jgi:hypothetical protein
MPVQQVEVTGRQSQRRNFGIRGLNRAWPPLPRRSNAAVAGAERSDRAFPRAPGRPPHILVGN